MKTPEVGDWIVFDEKPEDKTKLFIYEIIYIACYYDYPTKKGLKDSKYITFTSVYPTNIARDTYTAFSFQGMKVLGNPKNNFMLSILYS